MTLVPGGTAYTVDELATVYGLLFAVIWLLSAVYAWMTVPARERSRFLSYYAPAAAGGILVAFAADAISFYLCFALMALPSWGLVAWSGDAQGRLAGRLYLVATVVGEALLLAALALTAAEAESIALPALRDAMLTSPYGDLAFALTIGAFGLKLGVVGASGVLPLTYGHAPAGAAAALAGAAAKVGVLGLLRLLPLGQASEPGWSSVVVGIGVASAFVAVALGVLTTTPRAVLGYSSASQMGLVLIGVGVGLADPAAGAAAVAAAVAYSLHHGLAKATLFIGEDVARGSAGRSRGAMLALAALPAAALVGLPFTSGFAAKYALKDAVHAVSTESAHLAEALLPWAAVGTALLMLRFFALAAGQPAGGDGHRPGPRAVYAGLIAFVAGAVWAWPADWVASAAKSLTAPASLWAATWPALAAVALGAVAMLVARSADRDLLGVVLPGDAWTLAGRALLRRRPAPSAPAATGGSARQDEARDAVTRWLVRADGALTVWSVAAGMFVVLATVLVVLAT